MNVEQKKRLSDKWSRAGDVYILLRLQLNIAQIMIALMVLWCMQITIFMCVAACYSLLCCCYKCVFTNERVNY